MRKTKRRAAQVLAFVLLSGILEPSKLVRGNGHDFSRLVKEVESQFDLKRQHVRVFGLTKPVAKLARHSSTEVLDLAILERQTFPRTHDREFSEVAREALSQEWRSLVRIVSRRDGEGTSIYARRDGEHYRLIIATLEPNEVVLIQLKMNSDDVCRLIDNPEEIDVVAKRIVEGDESE
jgi:hypothetical protein